MKEFFVNKEENEEFEREQKEIQKEENRQEHHHEEHNHSHVHIHNHSNGSSKKNILTAFLLNAFFVIIEVVGGFLTNSVAILSDAIHDFGDCIAVGSAFFLEKKSEKEPDDIYTYGYKRYSIISALITSLILLVGGVVVIYSSINRMINPEGVNGLWMLIVAVFGVVINGIAVIKTSKSHNINEKSINLHMLEDVLGWIVVLIGSVFVYAFNWYIVDPIMSILVTCYIFYNVIVHILEIFSIILEKTPKGFAMEEYKLKLLEISNILGIHHVHVWTLDGENLLATIHVVVADNISLDVLKPLKTEIKKQSWRFGIKHITIQIDCKSEEYEECSCHIE